MGRLTLAALRAIDAAGKAVAAVTPSDVQVTESLFRILDANVLCSIATVTADGRPHVNTAYFSYAGDAGLRLYFLSHPASLHCLNLLANPAMALTVTAPEPRWDRPDAGVQLFGTAAQTDGAGVREAEASYARRFAAYAAWRAALRAGDAGQEYRLYRFEVASIKVLDEENLGDGVFVVASLVAGEA
jgi:uncharacterized protein YhbP (UPF0306 family)